MRAPPRTCKGCGIEFIPASGRQVFHSPGCASTHRGRKHQRRKAEAEGRTIRPLSRPGRVCTEPGCDWALCSYNPSDRCTRHGGWVIHHNGDRPEAEKFEDEAELYAELMELMEAQPWP